MKKFLSICAVILAALGVFAFLSHKTAANKTVFGNGGGQDEFEKAKRISLDVLRDKATRKAVGNVDEFQVAKISIDELKMAHTRLQQTIDNVPVWEGEAIVHLNADGTTADVTDNLKEAVAVNSQPNFTAEEATKTAKRFYKGSKFLTEKPVTDMWIFRAEDRDHLTYRVQMHREDGSAETGMPVIFVDAQTGEKVFQYDNLQTGTGSSLYSGTVTIGTSSVGSTYYMEDLTRKVGTFNYNNGTTTAARFTDTNDVWDSTAERAGVDAQYGATLTMNYYQAVHNRNGIDGSGGPGYTAAAANSGIGLITSRVHYSTNYNNAYWNGSYMTYGDGDGSQFTPLTTIDICGHEMTHGVTERTAALTYSNESGALNEAVSDIFGAMVERYAKGESSNTWKIGEDAYTPGTAGDALRYMDNPTAGNQPDWYPNRYLGTSDNGGVHTNSGIANYAFYLMAHGGTTSRGAVVSGAGADNAAKIWYRALTVYMTSGTTFAGARTATLSAATDLFGSTSTQYNSVSTAWCAVGVGSCTAPGGGGSELLTNGGFEGSASPWVNSGTGVFYTASGSYPHGGTGYDYFGVNDSVTGQTYQQVAIPSTATGTLTFWLNVTSSETGTTAYDNLYVEVRSTSGALLTTLASYSNANKGTAGAYSQKSFSLAAYKGQTVRIQFRATTDSSVATTFRVDDVSVK